MEQHDSNPGWLEFVVDVGANDYEALEAELLGHGALAISLTDSGNQPLLEPLPGEMPLWSAIRLTALFEHDVATREVESKLSAVLPGFIGEWRKIRDQAWERVWLERFKPRRFGRNLWVVPDNQCIDDQNAVVIHMDPGLAFGTGDHATTQLCLEYLASTPPVELDVLDYGHGSGILSIAASKLGARHVTGIDIDPQAVIAGNSNAERNGLSDTIRFLDHDVDADYDVLVANILATPLREMAEKIAAYLRPGGKIALSGILLSQADDVRIAYDGWIEWHGHQERDGWILLSGSRRS